MKFKFLSLLLLSATLFMTSCGDDEPDCTAASVAGTYTGTNDCDPDDITDATLTVTASGDSVTLDDGDGTVWTVALNGCSTETFSETIDIFGISITSTIDASFTDSNMTLTSSASGFGIDETCSLTLDKQ